MYHPTGRVLSVLEWLQSRPSMSGPELAERLETDVRSVRRYVQKLQDVGIPIESLPGRYGGYHLRPGFRLPPLIFSEDEATAVILGLLASPWLQVSLPPGAVESTLAKITRVLPETTRNRVESLSRVKVLGDPEGPRVDAATLLSLSRAVTEGCVVELEYQSRETTHRVVEPYGVGGFQGRWYLVGFCRLRQAPRLFRLDRIGALRVLPERFDAPANFDMDVWVNQILAQQPWKVRVRFEASGDEVRRVVGNLGTVEPAEGGQEYTGPTADLDFMARLLLFSGLKFRVVGPPELGQAFTRIADAAREAATFPEGENIGAR